MILNKVLTVDTGLTTAWAYWHGSSLPSTGEFTCPKKLSQVERISYLLDKFRDVLENYYCDRVILEMVELWEGSDKSRMSAVRGDTFGLALLTGAYVAQAMDNCVMNIELLTAREWKGQLSKEATAFRVFHINGQVYKSEHICDAVAMGFSRDYNIWHLKKKLIK